MTDFSYLNVDNAYKLINQKVTKTPLVTNDYINNLLEAEIYFKLENLQNTGSFKLRGATHKITKLIETVKDSGVVAYSSGNHAQAVAYASMINTISAKIIMPKTAPQIKIENTKKYGAEVILYDTYFQSREEIGNEIQKKDNRALIKPYDDEDIIEFDDTKRSLEAGKLIENKKNAKSFCDALLAPQPGNITFQINSNNLEGGLSVSDEEVTKTIILLAEQLKIVVEPGGAVAAAAALNNKIDVKNKKIIVMISGGNIDLSLFNKL